MLEETPIVQDTHNIRVDISQHFNNDFNQYINFLQMKKSNNLPEAKVKDTSIAIYDLLTYPQISLFTHTTF